MFPRFLTVAKYEMKQYSGSVVDEAMVVLICLAAFLLLVTPEVGEASLPSAYHIYRVGYLEGSVLSGVESYYFDMIPYQDPYAMMQDSGLDRIDAFMTASRGKMAVFGSGTVKSNAALSRLNELMSGLNEQLISSKVMADGRLAGILLPVRLTLIEDEIDYSAVINASMSQRRRELFSTQSMAADSAGDGGLAYRPEEAVLNYTLSGMNATASPLPQGGAGLESILPSLPAQIKVGVPFKNLYRNMMLLSSSMLLAILLSLSLARERIDRNIENLFAAPLSRLDIILGKSAPYLALMFFFSMVYGLILSDGLSALKIAYVFGCIAVTMVSFSLFSVIVSRSYRELTFVGSFGMFTFFFFIILPNVFSGINALAFISPLDLVTSMENNAAVSSADVLLAMLPYNFLALFFFAFTGMCFTAETVFQNMGVGDLFRAFYTNLSKTLPKSHVYTAVSVSLLVPFIFIVESLMAYLILPLGYIAPAASILLLAAVEEFAKILPYFYRRINPLVYGLIAGASFFLSEKLFNLYLINKVYSYLGGAYSIFIFRGLFMTFAVHVLSTTVLALVLCRGRGMLWRLSGFVAAVLVHVTYNILLMRGVL